MGHGHGVQGRARGLRLDVPSSGPEVKNLNAQVLGNALWAMATTFRVVAEAFDSMWQAAAQ